VVFQGFKRHVSTLPPPNRTCTFRASGFRESAFLVQITLDLVISVRFHVSPCWSVRNNIGLTTTFLLRKGDSLVSFALVHAFPVLRLL